MTKEQSKQATAIISSAAVSAAAISGLSSQIPLADNVVLSGVEITMTINLGKVFGREISNSLAWSIILSQLGTLTGKAVSQLLMSWIPGIGNITNAITSVGVIETLGWSIVDYFDYSYNN